MEFSELIKKRYSVRAYKPDPVEAEVLNQVLEAARLAPTAALYRRASEAHRYAQESYPLNKLG